MTHGLEGLRADRGQEGGERLPVRIPGFAGTERVPQERERRVLERATPPGVLAVNDPGLGRVQPQPDLLHPLSERSQHLTCLPLGRAVHHRIVGIALELHGRELAPQPRVQRVLHEQVGQDGRNR